MLYLIGLGLSEPQDITVKGLEIVKRAKRVYLEAYTSILMAASNTSLEEYYGRPILIADREMVEQESDAILENGQTDDIAFLVVGDPFGATTHTDLVLRARELGIKYEVVHNASVMNAVGACGLQLYTFGQCVSIVFFTENWRPDSFYHKIQENRKLGLHTLLLLDIKVKEQSLENIARGRKIYEPPRYMNIDTCAQQLLEVQEKLGELNYDEQTPCIAVSRLGSPRQEFKAGTLGEMAEYDAGEPLHSLVLMGHRIHDLERDFFMDWAINKETLVKGLDHDQKLWQQHQQH